MEQKYLILVDEQPQASTLENIKNTLKNDGFELVFTEINPVNYQKRNALGNLDFDEDALRQAIGNIPYFKMADTILCDYNLIADVVNGYRIITIIRELNYNKNKKILLYSAKIESVISDIINSNADFDVQKQSLANLIRFNIEFIKRDGYDQEVIRLIKNEPDFNFESELIKWFQKRDTDTFNHLFPKYKGKKFGEIAKELESNNPDSIQFKRELVEQIISYLSEINNIEVA